MNNVLLAKVIFTNKLATKEQIQQVWPEISPDLDIAQALIRDGVIRVKHYQQLVNYVNKLASDPKYSQTEAPAHSPVDNKSASDHIENLASKDAPEAQKPNKPKSTLQTNSVKQVNTQLENEVIKQVSNQNTDSHSHSIKTVNALASNDLYYGSIELQSQVAASEGLVQTAYADDLTSKVLSQAYEAAQDQGPINQAGSYNKTNEDDSLNLSTDSPHEEEVESLPCNFHGQRGDGDVDFESINEVNAEGSLFQILEYARRQDASDVHLVANTPITIRKFSNLVVQSEHKITQKELETIIYRSISKDSLSDFFENGDFETVITIKGAGRFRATYMRQRSGWDFSARIIAKEIMPFDTLGLPPACEGLTKWAQGLVLVTGPVGCGKTTSLATLVQMVNTTRKDHIITVESPVELVYPEGGCQMTQREVGLHTMSPATALKGALRQDPDILVVSELRDIETIELAVSAAETGHLVFGTMNTTNAARTITRLVDSFPPDEQDIIRSMISESLRGVICQQLVPLKGGTGVVPAFEVLLITPPVANLIRKNEIHQLESAMITAKRQGMVLLDDSLQKLIDDELVDGKECYYRANNPKNFEKYLPKGEK